MGGATLDWFLIQPKLKDIEADVLLLLDCCFGAQAARGRNVPSRVELLAASAMGVQAPPPGPKSFTNALIQELQRSADSPGGITISELHRRLCQKSTGLLQTPFHVDLGPGTRKSIRLRPLKPRALEDIDAAEGTQLTLQVTLRDIINKTAIPLIVQWLKHDAPPIVSRMTVENIISKSEKVQQFIFEPSPQASSALSMESFELSAKKKILEAWTTFATLVAKAEFIIPTTPVKNEGPVAFGAAVSERADVAFARELEMKWSKLMETIKEVVMGTDRLLDRDYLTEVTENASTDDIGLIALLKMRLMALSATTDANSTAEDSNIARALQPHTQPPPLAPFNHPELGSVLVEYKGTCKGDIALAKQSDQRVRQLADILSLSKPEEFRALACLSSFQSPDHSQYCLAFAVPQGCLSIPTSLQDVISKLKGTERPTLGQRFSIAFKIAQAVANWHRVGWVHQSVASYNVMLFASQQSKEKLDFSSPYLCGFEYARPNAGPSHPRYVENFSVAVYCHPDRQGVPSSQHRKRHDLYSLGVVLLEIGLWRPMKELFPPSKYVRVTPVEMKETLLKNARARLAHYMGTSYAQAVITCLTGEFQVNVDDESESRLTAAFSKMVINGLSRGVEID